MAEATTENQIFQDVTQRMSHFLKTGKLSDCSFLIRKEDDEVIIPGHKMVLALASPVFEAMCYGGIVEQNSPIRVEDVEHETFTALLVYIYTGNVNISSVDMGCELFYTARKYMLPCLEKECFKYLKEQEHNGQNVCQIYECAQLMEVEELIPDCIQFICTKTKEVINDDNFLNASVNTVTSILSLDFLNIDSELELIEAAARFAESLIMRTTADEVNTGAHAIDPSSQLRSIVEKIRFLTLTPTSFSECPSTSVLLTESECYAVIMNIASRTTFVSMSKGLSTVRMRRMQMIDNPSTVDDKARTSAEIKILIHRLPDLNNSVLSPPLYVRNLQWQIKIDPGEKKNSSDQIETCWNFQLRCNGDVRNSPNWSCQTDAAVTVLDSNGYHTLGIPVSHLFNREQKDKRFITDIAWTDLKSQSHFVYNDDIITFTITINPQQPNSI